MEKPNEGRKRVVIENVEPQINCGLFAIKRIVDDLVSVEADVFGESGRVTTRPQFEIDSAHQGQEGVEMARRAVNEGCPYAMAFVDMRMPPGWDGLETIRKIWEKYSALQVVICTAHHDHSWEQMVKNLGYLDRVVILNKPFDRIEISQLAVALTKKWSLNQQAELRVDKLEKLVEGHHLG